MMYLMLSENEAKLKLERSGGFTNLNPQVFYFTSCH